MCWGRMYLKYINDYIREKFGIKGIPIKTPVVCVPDVEVIKKQMELIEESVEEEKFFWVMIFQQNPNIISWT